MGVIEELKRDGYLVFDANYSAGSLLDNVGGDSSTTVSSPYWHRAFGKRRGIYFPASSAIYYADSATRKMIGGNNTWIICGQFSQNSTSPVLVDKSPGYKIYVDATNVYTYCNSVASSLAYDVTSSRMLAFTLVAGSKPSFYSNGALRGTLSANQTPATGNNALIVGNVAGYANSSFSTITRLVMCSTAMTSEQLARFWDEYVSSAGNVDSFRRNVFYVHDAKTDVECNSIGLVLDTDFSRLSNGKIQNFANTSYSGTVTGTPTQSIDKLKFNVAGDNVSWGDVTQFNSVTNFTLENVLETPAATNIPSSYLSRKVSGATSQVASRIATAAALTQPIYTYVSNGSDSYGYTSSTVLRAGCKQHVVQVYNGNGATDALKLQTYVDGEAYALTFSAAAIPSTTSNLAGNNFFTGYTAASIPSTRSLQRVYSVSMTAAQARSAYLKNFAQRVDFSDTFEDVPSSLTSASTGTYIGKWYVSSGGFQCVENSVGKKHLQVTGTTAIASIPQPFAFGTWTFDWTPADTSGGQYVLFIGSKSAQYTDSGQNGYFWDCINGTMYLFKTTAGSSAQLINTSFTCVVGTNYKIAITRCPSDCTFLMYMKGGTLTSWTLVGTAVDSAHTTSAWSVAVFSHVGDKLGMYEPRDSSVGYFHYQGQLIPTASELPQ